jgi:hypothetical protein
VAVAAIGRSGGAQPDGHPAQRKCYRCISERLEQIDQVATIDREAGHASLEKMSFIWVFITFLIQFILP